MAQRGIMKTEFLAMAYWVMLFLLYKTFSQKTGEDKTGQTMACGLSFGIVNTLAMTTFAEYNLGIQMLRSPNFVTNFIIGAVVGFVIGKLKDENDNFIKKGFAALGNKLKGPGWGKRAGQLATPLKLLGKGAAWLGRAGIKKARTALSSRWGTVAADMKLMQKLADEVGTPPNTDVLYGSMHNHSRLIPLKEARYNDYVNTINDWVRETDSGRKRQLEKQIQKIEKEMQKGTYPFTAPTTPTDTDPTYDNDNKNKNAHKSLLGAARNIAIENEIQAQKDTHDL